uniref:Uncharacterized protein n=1 Tax=Steinernema glaseri TaxID=37863 RepID=A0A1I7Z1N9_9BILA
MLRLAELLSDNDVEEMRRRRQKKKSASTSSSSCLEATLSSGALRRAISDETHCRLGRKQCRLSEGPGDALQEFNHSGDSSALFILVDGVSKSRESSMTISGSRKQA